MFSLEQYPLNFKLSELTPYMSEDTVNTHYGKHLAGYINNLNGLIAGTEYEKMELKDIIKKSVTDDSAKKIFNNAAQIFNHDFFFKCLKKNDDTAFPEKLIVAFGSKEKFMEEFKAAAVSVFGSGWAWLVRDGDKKLKIITTPNADTPIAHDLRPIMTIDVWEHAYYLDHKNARPAFIDTVLSNLINWEFVSKNL